MFLSDLFESFLPDRRNTFFLTVDTFELMIFSSGACASVPHLESP